MTNETPSLESLRKLYTYIAHLLTIEYRVGSVTAEDIISVVDVEGYPGGCDTCWYPGCTRVTYYLNGSTHVTDLEEITPYDVEFFFSELPE